MIEVMMADLPRVEYIDQDKITKEDIKDATKKTEALQKRVKARGLGANLGARIDPKAYLGAKMKK